MELHKEGCGQGDPERDLTPKVILQGRSEGIKRGSHEDIRGNMLCEKWLSSTPSSKGKRQSAKM